MLRAATAAVILLTLTACTTPPAPPTSAAHTTPAAATTAGSTSPQPVKLFVSTAPVIAPQTMLVADQPAPFTWRESVGASDVPEQGVTGRLGGRPFVCRWAVASTRAEEDLAVYRLRLSSKPRPADGQPGFDDDAVCLEWHRPEGTGEWLKPLGDNRPPGGDCWYVVRDEDGGLRTCSAEFALWLKIEALRGPTAAGGAPSMTGRLVVAFQDDAQSWLAGRFVADGIRAPGQEAGR